MNNDHILEKIINDNKRRPLRRRPAPTPTPPPEDFQALYRDFLNRR